MSIAYAKLIHAIAYQKAQKDRLDYCGIIKHKYVIKNAFKYVHNTSYDYYC